MKERELISFVIPCYNSTKTLPTVVTEINDTMSNQMNQYDYEVILVNDCSPDGTTYSVIEQLAKDDNHVKGINLARNFGQPSAVMAGMNHAKGQYVVCGDDDGQTPFSELPRFFEKIDEGFDVVEAKYVQREKRSLFRRMGTFMNESMATWLINKPKGIELTTFWVLKRFVVDEMLKYPNSYPYLGGLMMRATQKVCNVDVVHRKRLQGKSGYNIKKMLDLWMNGFTSFSIKPLRLLTMIGVLTAVLGFILGIVTIIRKLIDPSILAGYSSIISIMVFLFGIVFFILGMLGEYVGRIYISLNKAPQFVIREKCNFDQENVDNE